MVHISRSHPADQIFGKSRAEGGELLGRSISHEVAYKYADSTRQARDSQRIL